jgi:hypothetical protein
VDPNLASFGDFCPFPVSFRVVQSPSEPCRHQSRRDAGRSATLSRLAITLHACELPKRVRSNPVNEKPTSQVCPNSPRLGRPLGKSFRGVWVHAIVALSRRRAVVASWSHGHAGGKNEDAARIYGVRRVELELMPRRSAAASRARCSAKLGSYASPSSRSYSACVPIQNRTRSGSSSTASAR